MSASKSAHIIPFPTRMPVQKPEAADARLTQALAGLNAALAEQRAAMRAWTTALDDLKGATGRLGTSLTDYDKRLTHLNGRVASLGAESRKLEAWADSALAAES